MSFRFLFKINLHWSVDQYFAEAEAQIWIHMIFMIIATMEVTFFSFYFRNIPTTNIYLNKERVINLYLNDLER